MGVGLSVEVNPDGVGGVSGAGFCDAFAVFDDGDACTADGEFGDVEFAEVCDFQLSSFGDVPATGDEMFNVEGSGQVCAGSSGFA